MVHCQNVTYCIVNNREKANDTNTTNKNIPEKNQHHHEAKYKTQSIKPQKQECD